MQRRLINLGASLRSFSGTGWCSTDRAFYLDHGTGSSGYERAGNGITLKEKTDSKGKMARVLGVLVLCGLYYLVLGEVSIPGLRSES